MQVNTCSISNMSHVNNQTGFLPGRFIGDSVRAAEDALEIIQEEHPGGMLVALDFSKAFDSVRWSQSYKHWNSSTLEKPLQTT